MSVPSMKKLTHKSADWLKPIWRRGALRGDESMIAVVSRGHVYRCMVWKDKHGIETDEHVGRNDLWMPAGNLTDAQILATYPGKKWESTPVTKSLSKKVFRDLRDVLRRHNVRLGCTGGDFPKLYITKPGNVPSAYVL